MLAIREGALEEGLDQRGLAVVVEVLPGFCQKAAVALGEHVVVVVQPTGVQPVTGEEMDDPADLEGREVARRHA